MTVVAPPRRPSRRATLVAATALGAVFAAAPSFSGLALVAVLLAGGWVGIALFGSPYPPRGATAQPARPILRLWLAWTLSLIMVETAVILARDDRRWPPLSVIQDPMTSTNPVGRFVAGSVWAAAGLGLLALSRRFHGSGHASVWGRATAWFAGVSLLLLAIASTSDGPMLEPRSAPSWHGEGIDDIDLTSWPFTAWLTSAAFLALGVTALLIHRLGRSSEPPGALPDLIAWVIAPWSGRVLVYGFWLWSGWHFLAR